MTVTPLHQFFLFQLVSYFNHKEILPNERQMCPQKNIDYFKQTQRYFRLSVQYS